MALLQIADPEAEAGPVFAGEGSLLPILVLYNRGLRDSSTYRTFCASARACGWDSSRIAVYDNSRIRQVSHEEETRLQAYRHDPANGGLAAAYNWALEIALTRKDSWILLLDQDSTMPLCFLATLWKAMRLFSTDERVAAIVPYAMDGSSRVSPKRVRFGRMADLNVPTPSVADQEIMAINSGTALRASFIERLNGFNSAYKLDFLDHWLFRKIHASGMRVVLSGSVLEHNLAASDYRTNINTSRYYSIIASEVRFMRTEKQSLELPVYVGRLLLRSVKQLIVYRRRELAAITLSVAVKLLIRRSA